MKNRLKNNCIVFALAAALIFTFTFAAAPVNAACAEPSEYIVSTSYCLETMRLPAGVKNVEYADSHLALIKVAPGTDIERLESELKAQFPDIRLQPNFIYEKAEQNSEQRAVLDPYYSSQWGLYNKETGIDIGYEQAARFLDEKNLLSKKTVVAVIDTGIDTSHPDLAENIWVNKGEIPGNGKDDDKNGFKDDVNGYDFYSGKPLKTSDFSSEYNHGTHCAGIIGAVSGNYTGIAGVASAGNKIALMSLKVLGGKGGTGDTFSVVQAIKYAENNGADICNLSMCSYEDDPLLYSTISKSKMLFVCAAGNDGYNLAQMPAYPGCYNLSNVICVSNMDSRGHLYRSSNYSSKYADIAAPGTKIYSTAAGNTYLSMTGTSMAAPFVSGTAALLHSYYEGISASDMRLLLLQSAVKIDSLRDKVACGGYVNAYRALAFCGQDYFKPDLTPPKLTITVSEVKGSYKQRMHIQASDDSGITPVVRYARGNYSKSYFRSGKGIYIDLDEYDRGTRQMGVPVTYTVYAVDEAGNDTVKKVKCTADAVSSIKLNYSKKTISKGKSFRLKATLSKSGKNGRKLTYSSSKKSVAAVSTKGLITAKKKGTTYITVKTGNLLTAKCKVTVK